MHPTDLTVAAVIERDGKFLLVEKGSPGATVFTQPDGHIQSGESPEDACARAVLEDTGCEVAIRELLGVYLWIHPQSRRQFLRIVYLCVLLREDPTHEPNDGVHAVRWYDKSDIARRRRNLRTPVVTRCIDDYLDGTRLPSSILAGAMPIQQRVADVLANASLV